MLVYKINGWPQFYLITFLLVSLTACNFLTETPISEYKDYTAVIADGAIERGWIPDFLPQTAISIKERHDIDTNEGILTFSFKKHEVNEIVKICSQVDANDIVFSSLGASWWPDELSSSHKGILMFSYYQCNPKEYLAINAQQDQAYFWRR